MPQVFKMGPYLVYFWSNENDQFTYTFRKVSRHGIPRRSG